MTRSSILDLELRVDPRPLLSLSLSLSLRRSYFIDGVGDREAECLIAVGDKQLDVFDEIEKDRLMSFVLMVVALL